MGKITAKIESSVAWWFKPWLVCLMLYVYFTKRVPREEVLMRITKRAIRLEFR